MTGATLGDMLAVHTTAVPRLYALGHSVFVVLTACGSGAAAGSTAGHANSGEHASAGVTVSDTVCFEPEASALDETAPPFGLATDDLPDAQRWSDVRCVDESVLAPVVERYREHNRRVATEHLSDRGLTLLPLRLSDNRGDELVELDTVVEEGDQRWIAGVPGAIFARDRCGTIHRLGVHDDATSAIQRTASVCGCFAGGHSMLLVANWWMEPSQVPAPPPPRGALMEPEPARNHLYVLPEDAEVGAPINVTFRGLYRLLPHGVGAERTVSAAAVDALLRVLRANADDFCGVFHLGWFLKQLGNVARDVPKPIGPDAHGVESAHHDPSRVPVFPPDVLPWT